MLSIVTKKFKDRILIFQIGAYIASWRYVDKSFCPTSPAAI